jgi:hypothetical protein
VGVAGTAGAYLLFHEGRGSASAWDAGFTSCCCGRDEAGVIAVGKQAEIAWFRM